MNLVTKLIIAAVVAAATLALHHFVPAVPLEAGLFIVAIVTALLTHRPQAGTTSAATDSAAAPAPRADVATDGPREEGQVKWFNVSKGFGFITKDDGDEIFVHFRSIRGEGRRGLRDGQRVSFVEAQTDKGPQAEDVEPL